MQDFNLDAKSDRSWLISIPSAISDHRKCEISGAAMSTSVMPDTLEKLSVQLAQIWPESSSDQEYYRAVLLLVAELFETPAVVLHIPDETPRWFEHNAHSTAMGESFLEASLAAFTAATSDGDLTVIQRAQDRQCPGSRGADSPACRRGGSMRRDHGQAAWPPCGGRGC
jgi:hypothetical protein